MANYLLLYTGGEDDMPTDPAEIEEVMKVWSAWFDELGEAVVDGGNPILPVAKSIRADGSVRDGAAGILPNGYTILQAGSLDEAVEMAKGCPVLAGGSDITVLEVVDVNAMIG
jgi:hypothetical protein